MKVMIVFALSVCVTLSANAADAKKDRLGVDAEWMARFQKNLCESIRGKGVKKCATKADANVQVGDQHPAAEDIYRTAIERCFPEIDPVPARHSLLCLDLAKKIWKDRPVNENIRLCREFSELGVEGKISKCIRKALDCEIKFPSLQEGIRSRPELVKGLRENLKVEKEKAQAQWLTTTLREVGSENAGEARSCIEQTLDLLKSQPSHEQTTAWKDSAGIAADEIAKRFPAVTAGLRGAVTD